MRVFIVVIFTSAVKMKQNHVFSKILSLYQWVSKTITDHSLLKHPLYFDALDENMSFFKKISTR